MSILAIGDTHFTPANHEESEHFLLQTQQWLTDHPVKAIVILGDILHSHEKIFTFALQMAVRFIKMCATFAHTYCLVGNHDATSNTIYCGSNHWMGVLAHLDNVTVIDKPAWHDSDVLLCPYVSDGRFIEMLKEYAPEYEEAKLIFCHQLFDGAQMGAVLASNVEVWPPTYPQIVSGHIHDRQRPQPNLYYAGSSQQLAFNEHGDKSLALVDVGETAVSIQEVYLSLKQRKVIYTTVEDVAREIATIKQRPNVTYKVVVRDTDAAIKAFKKTATYKNLQALTNVVSVQFKLVEDVVMETTPTENTDFLSLLTARVDAESDPYLQSYFKSFLFQTEDLSDKDVVL